MPAITPPSASNRGGAIDGASSQKRKTRIVRRRGRTAFGAESDEEIEREVTSGEDTDGDQSSEESDSEVESLSDDAHMNGRSEVVTPSTTQSPPLPAIDDRVPLHDDIPKVTESGPFVTATDWADMVTAEHANGAEELPVIDFADLDRRRIDQHILAAPRSRKTQRQERTHDTHRSTSAPPAPPPVSVPPENDSEPADSHEEQLLSSVSDRPTGESHHGVRGQSARQAYQQRLDSDPSFVPKVGRFWGHDDRLLDKDLRSLSGWWRGRWHSRGRGRGAFNMRNSGGHGFGSSGSGHDSNEDRHGERDIDVGAEEVPPVERPWTHDGFEEMKRRDEKRRQLRQRVHDEELDQHPSQHVRFGPQRGFGFRGRGVYFSGHGRGGFVSSTMARPPLSAHNLAGRPWYAMKPERMWTKQHEAFLYFDSALKPRAGQGPGYKVKLPGGSEFIIRAPPRSYPITSVVFDAPDHDLQDEEKVFVVRLPPPVGREKFMQEAALLPEQSTPSEESVTTMAELSIEEVFTVRPNIVPNRRIAIQPNPSATDGISSSSPEAPQLPQPIESASSSQIAEVEARQQHHINISPMSLEPLVLRRSDSSPSPMIKETVLRRPSLSTHSDPISSELPKPAPPVLHPLQTTFSPVPQTSPSYGSPYAYGPALPPGVALNQHGVPYELATGRPVYLHQQTPPPMFTPRPMMHAHAPHLSTGVPFVPAHMHHHSTGSPDFLPQSHTPPVSTYIDPTTGVPIFAPARQSSRIEIRAPTDADGKKTSGRPSALRTSTSSSDAPMNGDAQQQSLGASMSNAPGAEPANGGHPPPSQYAVSEQQMAYPSYQQYYYPPEAYPYPHYIDVSPQVVHYDMYAPTDHRTPQPPMVYY